MIYLPSCGEATDNNSSLAKTRERRIELCQTSSSCKHVWRAIDPFQESFEKLGRVEFLSNMGNCKI